MPTQEELRRQRYQQQLTESVERSTRMEQQTLLDTPAQYLYYQKTETPLTGDMETEGEIEELAPPATVEESRWARKKREQREEHQQKARDTEVEARTLEAGQLETRRHLVEQAGGDGPMAMTKEQLAAEAALLKTRLEAIHLSEDSALETAKADGTLTEDKKREIRWRAQRDRAEAAGNYALLLPLGSKERKKAIARKETEELKADKLRRLFKVTQIENPAERQRAEDTIARHDKYDKLKSIFRKDNPLSREDASWTHPLNGHLLVNKGRAFFGGTKPMYIFEDRESPILDDGGNVTGYKQYLYKEAVNCIGWYKPEGALVTAAASNLQDVVCGQYSIPAFAAEQDGRVLGSFQEKLETRQGGVDLFSWQANPTTELEQQTKDELLREHMLDWLLCNFDTKGENFLNRTDGHLSSFDKEASFGKLKDPGAQHMSSTYKPHANDTIYNTIFTRFAQGGLTLDLDKTTTYMHTVENMNRETYLGLFTQTLNQKYGPAGPGNTARTEAEDAIWRRKDDLREEYRRFYTELLHRRREANVEGDPTDYGNLLDENGVFRFSDDHD